MLRVAIVVAVIAGLAIAIIQPSLSGAPVLPDPLTTSGVYAISPGNTTVLGGAITGEDYIEGNYTVVVPAGASVQLSVYNSTEYAQLQEGRGGATAATVAPLSSGRIVFAAPYTDTFYFVFTNPYPSASGIVLHVYIATNYESNVVIG